MENDRCEVCGRPATHFLSAARCSADGHGGPGTVTKLCEDHAPAHEQATAQATLNSMLNAWRQLATLAESTGFVEIVFDARNESAANQFAADLGSTCGGAAAAAKWPDGWVVTWHLPATVAAIDQWQCEGWSERVAAVARRVDCKLSGFALPVARA